MNHGPNDPVGTIRIAPDGKCAAARGFCGADAEPIWYMIDFDSTFDPEAPLAFGVDESWPVIWPREAGA